MILFFANCSASADDAPPTLPKDGWWVRYFQTLKLEDREISSKRTYALVGTTTEDERRCRWVEMRTTESRDGRESTETFKFLVPEQELVESERPLRGLVRCWRKVDDEPVEELKFNAPLGTPGLAGSADFYFGRDFALFPGPQRHSKLVEERRTVEYQRGRLEIDVAKTFQRVATRRALTNGEKQEYSEQFTIWNDRAVAPSFAVAKSRIEYRRGDLPVRTFEMEFVLENFGTDAKSALPDNN